MRFGEAHFLGESMRVRLGATQLTVLCKRRTAQRQAHLDTGLADVDGDDLTHGGWRGWTGAGRLVWKVDVGLRTRLLSHWEKLLNFF